MEYTMEYILEKFKQCDCFSLTSRMFGGEIPTEDKKFLIDKYLTSQKTHLKRLFDENNQDNKLGDFETVFNEIFQECVEFYKKAKEKKFSQKALGHSPFICDMVGETTKYYKPLRVFWHFYMSIEQVLYAQDGLISMKEVPRLNTKDFDDKENEVLKDNLIKHEFTYETHCTAGPLQLVYYFRLNDETKTWLLRFKTDFALWGSGFEDLALYQDGKLKFSSCTHEGFNSLG